MPRWFTSLSQRLAGRRAPEFAVSIRRVFVMPTRHGLMAALAIFGIFAISVRIQNNMLLLMAVALFVIFALSLLWAGQNLKGLRLEVRHDGRIVAGETARLSVALAAGRPVYDIRIDTGGGLQGAGTAMTIFSTIRPTARTAPAAARGSRRAFLRPRAGLVLDQPGADHCRAGAGLCGGARLADRKPRQGAAEGREEDGADSLQDWIPGTPQSRISWKRAMPPPTGCSRRRATPRAARC